MTQKRPTNAETGQKTDSDEELSDVEINLTDVGTRPEDGPTDVETGPSPRKERVLHTRVPAVLEQELKRFARHLRVPVSNIVRVILEDALRVADRATGEVENGLRKAASVVSTEREQIRETLKELDPLDDVLGFQPLILAQPTSCTGCGAPLRRGDKGWLGLTSEPGRRVIVCSKCVPERNDDETKENPS